VTGTDDLGGVPPERHRSVELFAGGGGMALGLRLAGFGHDALVELNHNATRVLAHNAAAHPALWEVGAVQRRDVAEWASSGDSDTSVRLVAGVPPCQPFSLSGAHAGHSDQRNAFPAGLDVVRKLDPELVVFENVPGLTRPSFAPYFEYVKAQMACPSVLPVEGELWHEHARRVGLGGPTADRYAVYEQHVDAADLGVAQSRRRVFLIAVRNDLPGSADWAGLTTTHSRDALLYDQYVEDAYWGGHGLPQPTTPDSLRPAIEGLKRAGRPSGERWRTLRDLLRDVPGPVDGQDHPTLTEHAGIPGARSYAKHTGSEYDWPSKTIKAGVHGIAGGEGMIRYADGRLRYLTVREAALVQGFPRDYGMPGVRSRVMGVIGNAVAVPVARRLGEVLSTAFLVQCLSISWRLDRGRRGRGGPWPGSRRRWRSR